jgi:hypothetical protein
VAAFSLTLFMSALLPTGAYGFDNSGRWTHYTSPVPQTDIKGIFSLPDGRICAGTDSSFHIFDRIHWKKYTYKPRLNSHVPFYADSDGKLYFLNDNHLVIWNDGQLAGFDSIELINPVIASAGNGLFYIGSMSSDGGVYTFDGHNFVKIKSGDVRSLANSAGKLWATMKLPGNGYLSLMTMEKGSWTDRTSEIDPLAPLGSNLTVQIAPDGAVWVCNDFSYGVYRNGSWSFRRNTQGNPTSLTFDSSGRVWGYAYQQIYLLDDSGVWKVSRAMQNIPYGDQGYMAVAGDSTVWTYDTHRLYSFDGKSWKEVENRYDLASDVVTCFAYSGDGKFFCGHGLRGLDYNKSDHLGISVREDTSWVNYKSYDRFLFPDVYDMATMENGDVVAYSNNGFFVYNGGEWASIDTLKSFDETDMVQDRISSDTMWFATTTGLVKWQGLILIFYRLPEIFSPWKAVYQLCFDSRGNMYMQTTFGTFIYTDRIKWELRSVKDLPSIMDFTVDDEGIIYAARTNELSWWVYGGEWQKIIDLDYGRLVKFDKNKTLWFSGYGATGYYENEIVKIIPEFSKSASDFIAFSEDDRIALNTFNHERTKFYGFYEYTPETVYVKEQVKPIPFLTATCFPNPFNPTVTIQFEIPKTARTAISVYNIAGQRVRTITDRTFNAGMNRVQWDSRSDSGNLSSSGIYFYKIESLGKATTGKMLLLR